MFLIYHYIIMSKHSSQIMINVNSNKVFSFQHKQPNNKAGSVTVNKYNYYIDMHQNMNQYAYTIVHRNIMAVAKILTNHVFFVCLLKVTTYLVYS